MDIRNLLFKYRSYTPIPIGLMIIYFARPGNAHLTLGIPPLLMGEVIRIWAVSYAGGGNENAKGWRTGTVLVGAIRLCEKPPLSWQHVDVRWHCLNCRISKRMANGCHNLFIFFNTILFNYFFRRRNVNIAVWERV